MVRFAIESVVEQDADFELVICNDESEVHPETILKEMGLWGDDRIGVLTKYYEPGERENGSQSGAMLNIAMNDSKADIVILLCDDDALVPGYLSGLSHFYESNPEVEYSYCHVSPYDPSAERYSVSNPPEFSFHPELNKFGYINPVCQVDASQVSWRRSAMPVFPSPQTAALDAHVFQQLFDRFGPCAPNELVGQYKGWFWDQMGRRLTTGAGVEPRVQ